MNRRLVARRTVAGALAATLAGLPWTVSADERGWIGFALQVDGDGPDTDPVLKSVVVTKVQPASPAAAAGVREGDRLVEVEGRAVQGARARELEPLMRRQPGEALRLRVERDGEGTRELTIVAGRRPE